MNTSHSGQALPADEIDHEMTIYPVCPFCGDTEEDYYGLEEGLRRCSNCGKDYSLVIFTDVKYCTVDPNKDVGGGR